jgi:hypothetical protein
MYSLESGEQPSHTLNWKTLGFLIHIKRRTNDDGFPLSLWEVWFCSTLGVPISVLIGCLQLKTTGTFDLNVTVMLLLSYGTMEVLLKEMDVNTV